MLDEAGSVELWFGSKLKPFAADAPAGDEPLSNVAGAIVGAELGKVRLEGWPEL